MMANREDTEKSNLFSTQGQVETEGDIKEMEATDYK